MGKQCRPRLSFQRLIRGCSICLLNHTNLDQGAVLSGALFLIILTVIYLQFYTYASQDSLGLYKVSPTRKSLCPLQNFTLQLCESWDSLRFKMWVPKQKCEYGTWDAQVKKSLNSDITFLNAEALSDFYQICIKKKQDFCQDVSFQVHFCQLCLYL